MDNESVRQLLLDKFEGCEVQVHSNDGSHFDVIVIGSVFEGLRPVKRQQLVYAALNDRIIDGSLHAVNIKTLTPAECAEQ